MWKVKILDGLWMISDESLRKKISSSDNVKKVPRLDGLKLVEG
jgi:hypothetical protein